MSNAKSRPRVKVVIVTSALLSFISFWRASAIILNDLASSAYYAAGIAEQAVGRAAPWFILAVMLFSYAVRAVYVESCTMFVRGGVYRVVKEAMGGWVAKISVSALMFDYILTGPISSVSAGQYIIGLIASTVTYLGHPWHPSKVMANQLAAVIAVVVVLYFWWRNIKGIHESSTDALRIMKVTTVMVVLVLAWCGITLLVRGPVQIPPSPAPRNLDFHNDALGWLPKLIPGAFRTTTTSALAPPAATGGVDVHYGLAHTAGLWIGLMGLMIAFGHSVLAMSGEESLAQVYRELEYPKHKNLVRTGMVIFIYSLLFTSMVSFFAALLIPNAVRPQYFDNLISGLAMNVMGPLTLRLLLQAFVVMVGFLILAGAVNTAIIGSNGVLNRVSEDGILTAWFRHPHKKYGTTYRMIDLIVLMQLLTIIGSRGDVYVLGEAYAFGVIWSFTFKTLAMTVLRYQHKGGREWKVPFNFTIAGIEIPLGLVAIGLVLMMTAVMNLFTKQIATIFGLLFTVIFFIIFTISEQVNRRKANAHESSLDRFNVGYEDNISPQSVMVKPGNLLVPVRNYTKLDHLRHLLERVDTETQDVVVMTIRLLKTAHSPEVSTADDVIFTNYENKLFSEVVALIEKIGKHVHLLVIPAKNIFDAMVQTARRLDSAEIVVGHSPNLSPAEQARIIGLAWEKIPEKSRRLVNFRVVKATGEEYIFTLGAHAPHLDEEDIALIHTIWLEVLKQHGLSDIHHRDVVRVALNRLERDLHRHTDVYDDFRNLDDQRKQPKNPE